MLNRLSGQYRIRILAIVAMAATGFFCQYSEAMAADAVKARKDIKAMGLEFTGSAFATVAGNDDLTAVQQFLDAGMDVNAGGGATIGVAAGRSKARMVQFLLSKGAKPTANALHYATTRGYPENAKMLTDARDHWE